MGTGRFRQMVLAVEAPPSARLFLRNACEALHRRLDAKLSEVDFDDARAYGAMLSRMSGPLSALELALTAGTGPKLFEDWSARMRSQALRRDLLTMDAPVRVQTADAVHDEAEALGTMYVLEGSRLGGRVLARIAGQSRDARVREATRFFRHEEDAGHWRSFLTRLESSPAVRAAPERTAASARGAFERFEAAFA